MHTYMEENALSDIELINENENTEPVHVHTHVHDPAEKKRQINRLSRVIGHLEHVKTMLKEDRDCADVLIQISAAKSALNGLGKEIIKDHTAHCIAHAIEDGDMDQINDFFAAMQKYLDV